MRQIHSQRHAHDSQQPLRKSHSLEDHGCTVNTAQVSTVVPHIFWVRNGVRMAVRSEDMLCQRGSMILHVQPTCCRARALRSSPKRQSSRTAGDLPDSLHGILLPGDGLSSQPKS